MVQTGQRRQDTVMDTSFLIDNDGLVNEWAESNDNSLEKIGIQQSNTRTTRPKAAFSLYRAYPSRLYRTAGQSILGTGASVVKAD